MTPAEETRGWVGTRRRALGAAAALATLAGPAVWLARRTDPDDVAGPVDPAGASPPALADRGPAPALDTTLGWLREDPGVIAGRVTLLQFWTFGCVNCKRTMPSVRAWHDRYTRDGLLIVGIHTPEFAWERDRAAIGAAADDLGVVWPVLLDDDKVNWRAFGNHYWPRFYLVDRDGHVRHDHIGEGGYGKTEAAIRVLLDVVPPSPVASG